MSLLGCEGTVGPTWWPSGRAASVPQLLAILSGCSLASHFGFAFLWSPCGSGSKFPLPYMDTSVGLGPPPLRVTSS
jgi:hypothetical protein